MRQPLRNPVINVKDIQDPIVQANFRNIAAYFANQNQILDFQFKELSFSEAESHRRVRHSLGIVPKDFIVTQLSGQGDFTIHFGLCDSQFIDVSASGPCQVRVYFGTKTNPEGIEVNVAQDASQTFTATP